MMPYQFLASLNQNLNFQRSSFVQVFIHLHHHVLIHFVGRILALVANGQLTALAEVLDHLSLMDRTGDRSMWLERLLG